MLAAYMSRHAHAFIDRALYLPNASRRHSLGHSGRQQQPVRGGRHHLGISGRLALDDAR
jgi:hypothetical protein